MNDALPEGIGCPNCGRDTEPQGVPDADGGTYWRFSDEHNVFSDGVLVTSDNAAMLGDLYHAYPEIDPTQKITGGAWVSDDTLVFWAGVDLRPAIREWVDRHYPNQREQ